MENPLISDALLLATTVISDSHGQIQVKEVARQSGYSERHLNRLFLTQIGMNIKDFARLTRFNYVLKHIQTSPCFFATLSQQAGYFDQAHFDKDFKAISGVRRRITIGCNSKLKSRLTPIRPRGLACNCTFLSA